ncbi:MAG: glycosyltransferase [Algicola sp.]|nr:glycosyltransferase [Algicola sp.]
MKVSIITVCYNSESTIRDTIESVLNQTYENIEYIVVDGGSSDSTLSVIKEYGESIDVLISEKDNGIYDAMNKGIKASTGDVVGIINSDDYLASKDSISEIVGGFDSNTDSVYGDLIYVKQFDKEAFSRKYSSKNFSAWKIRFGFMIPHPTFYCRRYLFDDLGFYKTNFRVAADFELLARFFKGGMRSKRIDKVLVKMREGGISSSGLLWRIHQNVEIARACRMNGIFTVTPMLFVKLPFKLFSYFSKNI